MYPIYTIIYGPMIPKELNKEMQQSEMSEFLWIDKETPSEMLCCIPYSGDDFADMHIGISLEEINFKAPTRIDMTPTAEEIAAFKKYMPVVKQTFIKHVEDHDEEYPGDLKKKDRDLIHTFVKALDVEPTVYLAYSTS